MYTTFFLFDIEHEYQPSLPPYYSPTPQQQQKQQLTNLIPT